MCLHLLLWSSLPGLPPCSPKSAYQRPLRVCACVCSHTTVSPLTPPPTRPGSSFTPPFLNAFCFLVCPPLPPIFSIVCSSSLFLYLRCTSCLDETPYPHAVLLVSSIDPKWRKQDSSIIRVVLALSPPSSCIKPTISLLHCVLFLASFYFVCAELCVTCTGPRSVNGATWPLENGKRFCVFTPLFALFFSPCFAPACGL